MAFGAALCWGVMPVYFKWLDGVDALEIVAHRVLWAVPMLLLILLVSRSFGELKAIAASPSARRLLIVSALLIAANWLIYVWAVHADMILAASLGYFISPLLNVALGTLFLKERLRPLQWWAIALAVLGVAVLAVEAWRTLWVSLSLAGSWAAYSLVRKSVNVAAVPGLAIETTLLWPVALGWLLWLASGHGPLAFGSSPGTNALLIGGALMTTVPLVLFAGAVRRISFTAIGLMQYVAPTMQFLIAALVYDEPLTTSHVICFSLIWAALLLFTLESWRIARNSLAEAPV